MTSDIRWTNSSVRNFASDKNPVEVMEARIRSVVLRAMDEGWSGPPFDPVELARVLNLPIEARGDIPDARTIPRKQGLVIEYNPLRPRARVRFSIAHEIAHSLFPDCADTIRNRGGNAEPESDDWQLEMLCNIGAAELLMPAGELPPFDYSNLSIGYLVELRKRFDVSTEAILVRTSKLSTIPCASFCASNHEGQYKVDYIIPSRGWVPKIKAGQKLPESSVVADANAIGYTAIGDEIWDGDEAIHVECIALSPYPGSFTPRVVGLIRPALPIDGKQINYLEIIGDALTPRGDGVCIVAHIVPDTSSAWGGWGFASQIKKKHPETWRHYQSIAELEGLPLALGKCFKGKLSTGVPLLNMVAQRGVGPSKTPRIRYVALEKCLRQLAEWAKELNATVHMPKIGAGHAGGDWEVIRELILDLVVKQGIGVTIYSLPPRTGNNSASDEGSPT
jgi:Zn-dependent peptidase ImmA (M78 family)/O-acetyl-ADP-ribose deacetylase (regulator of RNase III)